MFGWRLRRPLPESDTCFTCSPKPQRTAENFVGHGCEHFLKTDEELNLFSTNEVILEEFEEFSKGIRAVAHGLLDR
jgi:hypothetical protein